MAVTHGGRIFEVARQLGCDWREILDFSASINPLGPAPGVRDAIANSLDEIVNYPDEYGVRLQRALSDQWGVEPESVIVGNGATELIHFVASVWRQPVSIVVPAFTEFHRAFPNAALRTKDNDWPEAGLLVITNPVNPTGEATEIPSRKGLTLVDESFIEFSDLPTAVGKALVLRSLTKFHAIPGLRVGALVGPPELMKKWRERRAPWQLNVLAEHAALASIGDVEHHCRTRDYVSAERERLLGADLPGVTLRPSHANFLFAELTYNATLLCDYLLDRKILVRNCTGWRGIQGQAVRFSIRTRKENDSLLAAWREFTCD